MPEPRGLLKNNDRARSARSLLGNYQRIVYNGHKRVHSLKVQSVALPNGLIGNMFGPVGMLSRTIYIYIYIYIYIHAGIGKSETGFNLRLNNHRNHIKEGVNSEHFLHNVRSHNFDNDVTITVIGQIRKDYLTIDRKKELLRNREMFLQRMLNSIQPNGLNKRTG